MDKSMDSMNIMKSMESIKLEKKFKELVELPSDINQHLETLCRYSSECQSITEFGVRNIVSTYAFLYGLVNSDKDEMSLVSYDIAIPPRSNLEELQSIVEEINLVNEPNVDFRFVLGDTLQVTIEPTDLLFIDTLHTYDQLVEELRIHSSKVRKYIILHDTYKFGWRNQGVTTGKDPVTGLKIKTEIPAKNPKNIRGLLPAVYRFLRKNPKWYIKESFINNNGLTILAKHG